MTENTTTYRFCAVMVWNVFLPGLIYVNDASTYPMQVVLYNHVKTGQSVEFTNVGDTPSERIKAATVALTILPIVLVYPFLQKHFVKGVMLGAVKG